jgi:hypothetical protein
MGDNLVLTRPRRPGLLGHDIVASEACMIRAAFSLQRKKEFEANLDKAGGPGS